MTNELIARQLKELGVYLQMFEVPFKPQAYEKAALIIESLNEEVSEIYKKEGKRGLTKISGIGKGIADKIQELLKTGRIKELEQYRKKIPVDLDNLTKIEGLGPKTIKTLFQKLGIRTVVDLEKAARAGKIRTLPKFGLKSEQNILESLEFYNKTPSRFLLDEAYALAHQIIVELKKSSDINQIVAAGSLRRMKETIGDIDLLAVTKKPTPEAARKIMNTFINLKGVVKVWEYGLSKSSVRFSKGLDCDLRLVKPEEFGSALLYFTGSKEHNIALRKIALDQGYKLNEYGLFKGQRQIAGSSEEEIYKILGLSYIEPELRENTGEIEAALAHQLPRLVSLDDIQGDLHCHSDWDGGANSIEEIMKAAQEKGYHYVGISDHTKFLRIEHGLDEKQLLAQHEVIKTLNEKLKKSNINFTILHGCETNILSDGSLDISNKILAQLDYVVAGIHSQMKMSQAEMTQRLLKAIQNPNIDIISHPTGRLINKRGEYLINLEKILKAAKKYRTILEVNSSPVRLDLNDKNIKKAIKLGVRLVINTDSHQLDQLSFMKFGIAQARRGWATKENIINAWPIEKLWECFKKGA
jgi:DNA polymerase (family 10)